MIMENEYIRSSLTSKLNKYAIEMMIRFATIVRMISILITMSEDKNIILVSQLLHDMTMIEIENLTAHEKRIISSIFDYLIDLS
jgi:hypothetical protein